MGSIVTGVLVGAIDGKDVGEPVGFADTGWLVEGAVEDGVAAAAGLAVGKLVKGKFVGELTGALVFPAEVGDMVDDVAVGFKITGADVGIVVLGNDVTGTAVVGASLSGVEEGAAVGTPVVGTREGTVVLGCSVVGELVGV